MIKFINVKKKRNEKGNNCRKIHSMNLIVRFAGISFFLLLYLPRALPLLLLLLLWLELDLIIIQYSTIYFEHILI